MLVLNAYITNVYIYMFIFVMLILYVNIYMIIFKCKHINDNIERLCGAP